MAQRTYKLRSVSNTAQDKERGWKQHSLGVPQEVGRRMAGRTFVCQITDQGLLYTPVEAQDELPDWVDDGAER